MSQTKAQLIDTLVASLLPASDSSVDIGSNAVRFANIYGDTLYGNGANLTGINTDLVSDTSPQLGGTLDTNGNLITFGDSSGATDDRLKFGVGADLSIYHNATDSYIENKTNDLYILTSGSGDDIIIKSNDDIFIQPQNGEDGIKVIGNGAVELYYDNSKKFETTSSGCRLEDSVRLSLGSTDDFQLDHDGTNNRILNQNNKDLIIYSNADIALSIGGTTGDISIPGASNKDLLWDKSAGSLVFYDNAKAKFGTGADLQIYHDGSNSYIKEDGTGSLLLWSTGTEIKLLGGSGAETLADFNVDGAVELYHDGNKKFETTAGGVQFSGTEVKGPDNCKFVAGTSGDADFYHDGSNTILRNLTGNLCIRSNNNILFQPYSADELFAKFTDDGAVELYYDNSKKFETTSSGVAITGEVAMTGGSLKLDSHPLVSTANFTDISGGSYAARLGSTGTSTIRSTQIYGGGGHIATFDGVNVRLGINTTTPDTRLHVEGSGTAILRLTDTDTTAENGSVIGLIEFETLDTNGPGVNASIGAYTRDNTNGNAYIAFKVGTAAATFAEEVRIDNDGIKFNGDSASDNGLDDYEKGTWSPSGSWTTITASYTKIGRMVYAGFSLRANATSGNVTIGNLPFTSGSTHGHVGGITWGLCEFNTTDSWLNGSVDDDSTTATVRRGNATIVTYGSGNNNMNQNAFIRGMIIYMTD